ncbi:MAG: Trm112 family protein [Proteobacteria bacterium]|nr:Trm112 family protein [Pseudomonadota bacterium]
MSLDHRLLTLLVCPLCKGPLELLRDGEQRPLELACKADRLAFPIRDGMPVMLEREARSLLDADADAAPAAPAP